MIGTRSPSASVSVFLPRSTRPDSSPCSLIVSDKSSLDCPPIRSASPSAPGRASMNPGSIVPMTPSSIRTRSILSLYPCPLVVLSCDNEDEFRTVYLPHLVSLGISHYALGISDPDLLQGLNELQIATLKMLVLSQLPHVIANRISTFSELIFWFGRCKPIMHVLF